MMKKNCNWPELGTYCGCCKLSTGIYIRFGLSVMLLSGLSFLVISNMVRLLRLSREFHNSTNQTVLVEYLDINLSPANHESLIIFFKTVIFFHIIWLAFRLLYVSKTFALCYAIYKSKVATLKVLLYISIPCSIFDVILSILGFFLFRHVLKIFLLLFYLSEGYNLLAIYSEYKRISGTSRIIRREDIGEPVDYIGQGVVTTPSDYCPFHRPHCQSCTCFITENITPTSDSLTVPIDTAGCANYTFKNDNNRDHQNNLICRNIEMADERNENINCNRESSDERNENASYNLGEERPKENFNLLDFNAKEKVDMADAPVIYDEEQLQPSSSPIIENTKIA